LKSRAPVESGMRVISSAPQSGIKKLNRGRIVINNENLRFLAGLMLGVLPDGTDQDRFVNGLNQVIGSSQRKSHLLLINNRDNDDRNAGRLLCISQTQ